MKIQNILLFILFTQYLTAQSIGIKTISPMATLDINGSVAMREGTPLSIANGTNNNVAIDTMSFYRITAPTAVFTISGFTNGYDGRILTIVNTTSYAMTIKHNTGSIGTNCINSGGSDVIVAANGVATFMYNITLTKWVLTGGQGFGTVFPSWAITGNSSTVDGTNFLGSTDNIPLSIKVNNQQSGRIDHLLGNTLWGYQAANSLTSGNNNTALGHQALMSNTNAWGNTAFGYRAAYDNTTGQRNVAIGDSALYNSTTTSGLTAVGYQAGATTTADSCVFVGNNSGPSAVASKNNMLLGNNTDVSDAQSSAVAIGYSANVTCSACISLGGTVANAVYVGIGTTTPQALLHLTSNGTGLSNDIYATSYHNSDMSVYGIRRYRGTEASPSNVVNGDLLGGVHFYGYTGGSFTNLSRINATYQGNGTTNLSSLEFWTSAAVRMSLNETGYLGIGTTTQNSRLEVVGSVGKAITTTSTNLTLDDTHHTVIITSGTPSITLPTASTCTRRIYTIVNRTGTNRTISTYNDFSGASTIVALNSNITIQSDGSAWYRIE